MSVDTAATRVMIAVAKELRDGWRESGACVNYHARAVLGPNDEDDPVCADCGISTIAHQLLRWAERLERAAKEPS